MTDTRANNRADIIENKRHNATRPWLNERRLSVLVHSLFSAWMLSFLFEGQILYGLASLYDMDPIRLVREGILSSLGGLLFWGCFIKTKSSAKRMFLSSYPVFAILSTIFFFPPTLLWEGAIIGGGFLAGGCVASWAFFLKSSTPKNERIKTVADLLILTNCLLILLTVAAIHLSPRLGLVLSMVMLAGAFGFALLLPGEDKRNPSGKDPAPESSDGLAGVLGLLCIFIAVITINSGLMYQVITPAFSEIRWLASWYWPLPYIAAILIMRNLPSRINRTYILYVAVAMMGLSFIAFMSLGVSPFGYLVVNTLMLGAFGVFDLFWWTILAEMLEFHKGAGKIFGIGLSANVLGVLIGGLVGQAVRYSVLDRTDSVLVALSVVCVTLILLPLLHKSLSNLLKDQAYLLDYSAVVNEGEKVKGASPIPSDVFAVLSEREKQVASLLLQGKTYRNIATELIISENTVKYYVKNIYSKFDIQSRAELIDLAMKRK